LLSRLPRRVLRIKGLQSGGQKAARIIHMQQR
jgi:hypothetical protein